MKLNDLTTKVNRFAILYSRLHIGWAQRFPEARRLSPEDIEALDMLQELAMTPNCGSTWISRRAMCRS